MPKSSDPIVLSLEAATDSHAFELLSSDILAGTNYPGIEPIGGTGDGGRDALYADHGDGAITVCAFSLRKDWTTKLKQDCDRVRELSHRCDHFLFATSMQPTPDERDKVVEKVEEDYGWHLELYGRQRLATAVRGGLEHLIERHPSIFRKAQFRLAGGRLLETSNRDVLLVDHVDRDQGFAHWIARCLRLFGYDVWCRGIDSTSGEIADDTIRELLQHRARHHLPIFSTASVESPEFRGRVEQSVAEDRRLLPLRLEVEELVGFSQRVRSIDPVAFEEQRATGIGVLREKLEEWDVPRDHEVLRKREAGLRLPTVRDFVRNEPEIIGSNVFPVTFLPDVVLEWRLTHKLNKVQVHEARRSWAFVKSGDLIYSFTSPPEDLNCYLVGRPWSGSEWRDVERGYYDGKDARDVVSELLRRTLELAFYESGLLWCLDRELFYFDPEEFSGKRLPVRRPSGETTNRAVCGQKHRWAPQEKGEDYDWQLAPSCRSFGSVRDPWEFRTRVMIRVTYRDGRPIEGKRVVTFRKHAAGGWNQGKFRDLNLLFMQHAGEGQPEIVVGEGDQRVVILTDPRSFSCPMSIDEAALPKGANKFARRTTGKDRAETE